MISQLILCTLAEVATKMGRRRVAHSQRLSISAVINSDQREGTPGKQFS